SRQGDQRQRARAHLIHLADELPEVERGRHRRSRNPTEEEADVAEPLEHREEQAAVILSLLRHTPTLFHTSNWLAGQRRSCEEDGGLGHRAPARTGKKSPLGGAREDTRTESRRGTLEVDFP